MIKKDKQIKIRCAELLIRKLSAICAVTGKTKTAIIEELINSEYEKDDRYRTQYYADLNNSPKRG